MASTGGLGAFAAFGGSPGLGGGGGVPGMGGALLSVEGAAAMVAGGRDVGVTAGSLRLAVGAVGVLFLSENCSAREVSA